MSLIPNNRGDTIVEVLIAVSVVSALLVSAFNLVRQNTIVTQTAQERGEALKLAEEQVELLKVAYRNPNKIPSGGSSDFCIINDEFKTDATCTSGPVNFTKKITRLSSPDTDYTITVSWDSHTTTSNKVELNYRAQ